MLDDSLCTELFGKIKIYLKKLDTYRKTTIHKDAKYIFCASLKYDSQSIKTVDTFIVNI